MTTAAPEPRAELEPSDFGRFEPSPYDLGITDDPEVRWADIQPGEREFCAQDAASYPEHERQAGEAAAARMAELEQQAAEIGLDVFGDPLPDPPAPEPEADLGDQPIPYTLTAQGQAIAAAEPEPEPEPEAGL
jgi:hypothetical protein